MRKLPTDWNKLVLAEKVKWVEQNGDDTNDKPATTDRRTETKRKADEIEAERILDRREGFRLE